MTDIDVRDALGRATSHLSLRPDLLAEARAGGQRRLVRRRSVLAAGLAALGVGAGGIASGLTRREAGPARPAMFDRRTGGDLAQDRDYLDRVLAAWAGYRPGRRDEANIPPVKGAPHVYWAGVTPAGAAAFVVQRLRAAAGHELALGLVAATPLGPRVQSRTTWSSTPGVASSRAFLVGAEREVLILLGAGVPVRYCPAAGDGRAFRPVPFVDGVAVLAVPPQRGGITLTLLAGSAAAPTRVPVTPVGAAS